MQSPPAVLLRGVNQPGCSERVRRDVGVHAQPTRRDGLLDACSIFLRVPPGNLTRKQTNNLLEIGPLLFVVVFFHPYSTNLSGEGRRETSSRHTQTRRDATLTRLCNSSAALEIAVEQICHLFRPVTTGLQRRASVLRSLEPYQGSNKTYFRTTNTRNVARRVVRQNLSQKIKKAVSIHVQVQSQYAHNVGEKKKKQDWHSVILSRMKRSCSDACTQAESCIRQAAREDSFLHCVQRVVSSHNKKQVFLVGILNWHLDNKTITTLHWGKLLLHVLFICSLFNNLVFFLNSSSRKHVFTKMTLQSIHQFITTTLVVWFYAQHSKVTW